MIDNRKIFAMGRRINKIAYLDARDGVVEAIKLLEKNDAALTPLQKEVLMFGVEVAERQGNDTWDHEVIAVRALGPSAERVAKLLEEFIDE